MRKIFVTLGFILMFSAAQAKLEIGDAAPDFSTVTQEEKKFSLSQQKGRWTVLYFYPKADTPGCTKQACAFRDSIKFITDLGAEIYGISGDEPQDNAKFHKKHQLNFNLLSDPKGEVMKLYGTKMMGMNISKRWTFIIDPELKIRHINTDVDPVKDALQTAKVIKELKEK